MGRLVTLLQDKESLGGAFKEELGIKLAKESRMTALNIIARERREYLGDVGPDKSMHR